MPEFGAVVFLDRDGTLIEEKRYLADPAQVQLVPEAAAAIAALNRAGIAAVLVTNQSGVARGYFDVAQVHAVHARLEMLLAREGAQLDGIYYCPHLATATVPAYRLECSCRKPAPGLVEAARAELGLYGVPAFVVGDKEEDIALGQRIGAASILVRTGYGAKLEAVLRTWEQPPAYVADRLPDAVAWILARLEARSCAG